MRIDNYKIIVQLPIAHEYSPSKSEKLFKEFEFSPYEWEMMKWYVIKSLDDKELQHLLEAKKRGETYSYWYKITSDKNIFPD